MYKKKFAELFTKPTETTFISNNVNMDLFIIICIIGILLFVFFLTYNQSIEKREKKYNQKQKKLVNKNNLENITNCDKERNYRLVDYYIASSYNTASLGNKHYDYVSLDAIKNTLLQGARYIQLNICSTDLNINNVNDEPVIGTCMKNKFRITSLNTILFKDAINIIKKHAFEIQNSNGTKNINYPLIIDFYINTKNIHVLNKAADIINEHLSEHLLDKSKYVNYPIQYEYLCNILGKIIIWVNGDVTNTRLNEINIPKNLLIQSININSLTNSVLKPQELQLYINNLSNVNIKNNSFLENIVNNIKKSDIVNFNEIYNLIKVNFDENNIISNNDLENKLIIYNSLGMSIIEPDENDIYVSDYDIKIPFYAGCQIIAISYQNTETANYKLYRKLFQNNSFILKSNAIRVAEVDNDKSTIDILEQYELVKQNFNNFNYEDTYYFNNYNLLYLQEITSSNNNYLSISDKNVVSFTNNTLKNNNYFLLKSYQYNDINAYLITNPVNNKVLTIKENYQNIRDNLYFTNVKTEVENIKNQLFVIEKGLTKDEKYSIKDEKYISIRSVLNTDIPLYLSIYKKSLILKPKNEVTNSNFITFNSGLKPAVFSSKIENVLYGPIRIFNNGFAGVVNNNSEATPLVIEYNNKHGKNSTYVTIKVDDNKYLYVTGNKIIVSQEKYRFILEELGNGEYFIKDDNKFLYVDKKGLLLVDEEFSVLSNAEYDENGNVIKQKRTAAGFGSAKYFKITSSIKL